jgi:hypothetical protein
VDFCAPVVQVARPRSGDHASDIAVAKAARASRNLAAELEASLRLIRGIRAINLQIHLDMLAVAATALLVGAVGIDIGGDGSYRVLD